MVRLKPTQRAIFYYGGFGLNSTMVRLKLVEGSFTFDELKNRLNSTMVRLKPVMVALE